MAVYSSIANYGGKITNNTTDIKQFVLSPTGSTVEWCLKNVLNTSTTKYITPVINNDVYIDNLTVKTFTNISDASLKENIVNIHKTEYEKILNIVPKKFNFINDKNKESHFGLIAQELEDFFPELVGSGESNSNTKNTKNIKTVNYMELIPLLICKINDLQEQINDLQEQINELKETNK